jgi:hypothetical protein
MKTESKDRFSGEAMKKLITALIPVLLLCTQACTQTKVDAEKVRKVRMYITEELGKYEDRVKSKLYVIIFNYYTTWKNK